MLIIRVIYSKIRSQIAFKHERRYKASERDNCLTTYTRSATVNEQRLTGYNKLPQVPKTAQHTAKLVVDVGV